MKHTADRTEDDKRKDRHRLSIGYSRLLHRAKPCTRCRLKSIYAWNHGFTRYDDWKFDNLCIKRDRRAWKVESYETRWYVRFPNS